MSTDCWACVRQRKNRLRLVRSGRSGPLHEQLWRSPTRNSIHTGPLATANRIPPVDARHRRGVMSRLLNMFRQLAKGKEPETAGGVPRSDRNYGCGHAAGAGLVPPSPDLRSANRVRVRWISAGKDCLQICRAGRSGRARREVGRRRTGCCGAFWESVASKRRWTILAFHGLRNRISRRAGTGTLRLLPLTAERNNFFQHAQSFTRRTYLKA